MASSGKYSHIDNAPPQYSGLTQGELVEILRSEEDWCLPSFSAEVATDIGTLIHEIFNDVKRFHQDGTSGIAYSITLFSGVVLCAGTVGVGVAPDNMEWLKRKSNTVRRFGTSSWLRGQSRLLKGRPADDPLLGSEYAAHGGAVPIRVQNVTTGPIGALAISGLTQELDHEIATLVMARFVSGDQV